MKIFLRHNQLLTAVITAWLLAQVSKTLIYLKIEGRFRPERLIGAGGMPSSHSATVVSLAVTAFIIYGVSSFEFAVSVVLAIVVMHDAMGVRLETGKQARVINAMLEGDLFNLGDDDIFNAELKELIGHTPLQVICGAVLGAVTAGVIALLVM